MKKLGKIWIFVIASIAIVALAIPIALAQSSKTTDNQTQKEWRGGGGKRGGHHRGGRGGFGMHGMMAKQLNLTDAQKAQMKQIGESFRERTKSLHTELRTKHNELRAANEGSTFNEALAAQKLTEIATLKAKLMGEQFKLKQEMLSVLTPEQKTKMETLRAESKAKRAQFKGKRGGEGAKGATKPE
jgi:periplasmic protein CpxP/Spy